MRGARSARRTLCALVLTALAIGAPENVNAQQTENVVLIVTDGLRWQEVFRGAERRLISARPGGVGDTTALLRAFWRDDTEARRKALLPFLWGTVATQGVIFGNQDQGSIARITNRFRFSYPGYNELFTGWFDERIDSNEYPPNPNVTVFEWLARERAFKGRVGAVATWDAFRRILNPQRAGIDVIDGWDEPFPDASPRDARRTTLNAIYRTQIRVWPTNAFDAPMHEVTKEYVQTKKPRLLFVGYGETDEWAHAGRYDLLLHSAHQVDAFIADLWSTMQGMRQYRGKTTFIITADHGRGSGAEDWKSHGERVPGAEDIWIAVIGPDTPALGERLGGDAVSQSQVAATIAALLGRAESYRLFAPRAAPPVSEVLPPRP